MPERPRRQGRSSFSLRRCSGASPAASGTLNGCSPSIAAKRASSHPSSSVDCFTSPVSRFLDRLSSGPPIVADGGMGALISAAVPRLRCAEEANLRAPESVVSVHVAYIRAGAELIETNTFGANRPKLASGFLEDEFERINSAAVRLARE